MKRMLAPLPPPTVDELLEPSGMGYGSAPSLDVFSRETPFVQARRAFLRDRWDEIVTRAGVARGNDSLVAARLSLFAASDRVQADRQSAFLARQRAWGSVHQSSARGGLATGDTASQSKFLDSGASR